MDDQIVKALHDLLNIKRKERELSNKLLNLCSNYYDFKELQCWAGWDAEIEELSGKGDSEALSQLEKVIKARRKAYYGA